MNKSEKVLSFIEKSTRSSILNYTFDIQNNNALAIGLDLNMARSNASRILNHLYREGELIKVKTRPVIYLSKRVINDIFGPGNQVPDIIENVSINNLLIYLKKFKKSNPVRYIHFFNKDLSPFLHKYSREAFPLLLFPNDQRKILVLSGKEDFTKQMLINSMLEEGKRIGIFDKSSQPIYFHNDAQISQFFIKDLIQQITQSAPHFINIHTTNKLASLAFSLINSIDDLYRNHYDFLPVIVISVRTSDLSPQFKFQGNKCLNLPALRDCSRMDIISFIAGAFQQDSNRLHKSIIVPLLTLTLLLALACKASADCLPTIISDMIANGQVDQLGKSIFVHSYNDKLKNELLDNRTEDNEMSYLDNINVEVTYTFAPNTQPNIAKLIPSMILQQPSNNKSVQDDKIQVDNAFDTINKYTKQIMSHL